MRGRGLRAQALSLLAPIHQSAWTKSSPKFATRQHLPPTRNVVHEYYIFGVHRCHIECMLSPEKLAVARAIGRGFEARLGSDGRLRETGRAISATGYLLYER